MALHLSLRKAKSKEILLIFFVVASLLPLLIAIFTVDRYIIPLIGERGYDLLHDIFVIGLSAMFFLSLLGLLFLYKWINSLEIVTSAIMLKSTALAKGQEEFGTRKIEESDAAVEAAMDECSEGSEIHSLVKSFNSIFQTAADQLAERNRLHELLARLIGISSSLTAELDFDRLFPLIISHVTEAMQAERTSMYVVDRDKGEIWTRVAEGVKHIRLPLGQGISGRVAETGAMLNVVDAWELPYFDRSFDLKNNFRTRSVLCLPIKNRFSETIGALQVINKKGKDRFDSEDEVFLKGLASQIAIALENSLLVDEILLSFTSSMSTLSAMVDAKHHFTAGHSERVTEYSLALAEKMNLPKEHIEVLKYAALLHDIGKIGIMDSVLTKNGPFTPEEFAEMKTHPTKTKTILDKFHFPRHLRQVPDIAWRHHEKMNGTGYPDGLQGDKIPMGSRIIAVADVFDALTSRRDYPKYAFGETMNPDPMPLTKVTELMNRESGNQFDPQVIDALMRSLAQLLLRHRGDHFSPAYVDDTIRAINPELLP